MTPVAYFRLQAKNLMRDYKTKSSTVSDGSAFDAKYFDVDAILLSFNWDEDDFSLMKAQHTIAILAGFRKWTDLANASVVELELAKLIFDHQDRMTTEEWEMYVTNVEHDTKITFDSESRLELYKHAVLRG